MFLWIAAHAAVTHANCLNTARQHGACATGDQVTVVTKLIWQDNLTWACQNSVRSSVFTNTLEEATEQTAHDPNKALDIFVSLLLSLLSQRTKKKFTQKGIKQGAPWFDSEYRQSKQSVKRLMRLLRRIKGGRDRVTYVTVRTKCQCFAPKEKEKKGNTKKMNVKALRKTFGTSSHYGKQPRV